MEIALQGRVLYNISVIVQDQVLPTGKYSQKLWRDLLRDNIPEKKEIFFNKRFSRTETTDVEGDFKSPVVLLKKAGKRVYQYCKEFPYFNFYLNQADPSPVADEYFLPKIQLLQEQKEIAGYLCNCAQIETLRATYLVYYTDRIQIHDATAAIIRHNGIAGFILQQDEIPVAKDTYFHLRYTVLDFDFETPVPDHLFQVPKDFLFFADMEQVRKENRRIMNEMAKKYWQQNPLTELQKSKFNGKWKLDHYSDTIEIEVSYKGSAFIWENKYQFTTKNSSAGGGVTIEQASLWEEFLLVEDPPNYRLYIYDAVKDKMKQYLSAIFIFSRQ